MIDEHSRKALSNFLMEYLDVEEKGKTSNGMLNDKAIKQGLSLLDESGVVSLNLATKEIAKKHNTIIPTYRLKKFMDTGEWLSFVNIG